MLIIVAKAYRQNFAAKKIAKSIFCLHNYVVMNF